MSIGPHLLGRVPSDPDPRNYRLASFLRGRPVTKDDAKREAALHSLQELCSAVQHSLTTSRTVKDWAVAVTELLAPSPAPHPAPPSAVVQWTDAHQLDQSDTPHCVGFGWAQYGNCLPVDDNYHDPDGHAIYYECKVIDGEPRQEDGSSVHSGAKAMKARGRINAYAWAGTLDEITTWLQTKGPVVVGTDWTADMFTPDQSGMIHPTGEVKGGHCYILVGYDGRTLKLQNSWGASWGLNGFAYIDAQEWWQLFQSNGEACTGVELAT